MTRLGVLVSLLFAAVLPCNTMAGGVSRISTCGEVLDQPGKYELANDLDSCSGFAVYIVSSDISLNLAGHRISCDAVDGVLDIGIEVDQSSRVSIQNGEVADCDIGIELYQSHHSRIVNVTATGNRLDPYIGGGTGITGWEATYNQVIGNTAFGNVVGIAFFFSSHNRLIGNISTENSRVDNSPFPSFGIGVAVAYFSNHNVIIGNEGSRNSDAGVVVMGSTGNTVRDNIALENEYYGVGMFSREDFGAPLAWDNLNQSNVALDNGRADILEAKFDPYANPRELVQPACANSWIDNTYETVIAPDFCVD